MQSPGRPPTPCPQVQTAFRLPPSIDYTWYETDTPRRSPARPPKLSAVSTVKRMQREGRERTAELQTPTAGMHVQDMVLIIPAQHTSRGRFLFRAVQEGDVTDKARAAGRLWMNGATCLTEENIAAPMSEPLHGVSSASKPVCLLPHCQCSV